MPLCSKLRITKLPTNPQQLPIEQTSSFSCEPCRSSKPLCMSVEPTLPEASYSKSSPNLLVLVFRPSGSCQIVPHDLQGQFGVRVRVRPMAIRRTCMQGLVLIILVLSRRLCVCMCMFIHIYIYICVYIYIYK